MNLTPMSAQRHRCHPVVPLIPEMGEPLMRIPMENVAAFHVTTCVNEAGFPNSVELPSTRVRWNLLGYGCSAVQKISSDGTDSVEVPIAIIAIIFHVAFLI